MLNFTLIKLALQQWRAIVPKRYLLRSVSSLHSLVAEVPSCISAANIPFFASFYFCKCHFRQDLLPMHIHTLHVLGLRISVECQITTLRSVFRDRRITGTPIYLPA